jgi:hypothetical protein
MAMMAVPPMESGFEAPRYYWREMEHKVPDGYPPPTPYPPQLNIVQRISGLIKSQLPLLQALMNQLPKVSVDLPVKRHRSRDRSRSRSR